MVYLDIVASLPSLSLSLSPAIYLYLCACVCALIYFYIYMCTAILYDMNIVLDPLQMITKQPLPKFHNVFLCHCAHACTIYSKRRLEFSGGNGGSGGGGGGGGSSGGGDVFSAWLIM